MRQLFKLISAIGFTFALFSASAFAQNSGVILSNDSHVVSYRADAQNVTFALEMIDDFTDDTKGDFPNKDFVALYVDVNQNAMIDANTDSLYGEIGKLPDKETRFNKGDICTSFLLSANSTTGCGRFKSAATFGKSFQATGRQATPHPVFEFLIPRGELSADGSSAHVCFEFYSAGKRNTFYPAHRNNNFFSFDEILKVEF